MVSLRYQSLYDPAGKPVADSAVTMFQHRDLRVWRCETIALPEGSQLLSGRRKFITKLRTAGAVPVRFLSRTMVDAKASAERFANMPMDQYLVLIADAVGTNDHPQPGVEVVADLVTPPAFGRAAESLGRRHGRLCGFQLMLFPTWQEADEIIEHVLSVHCVPLNSYVENAELPHDLGFFDRVRDGSSIAPVTGTEESLLEQLYPTPSTHSGREERFIQL